MAANAPMLRAAYENGHHVASGGSSGLLPFSRQLLASAPSSGAAAVGEFAAGPAAGLQSISVPPTRGDSAAALGFGIGVGGAAPVIAWGPALPHAPPSSTVRPIGGGPAGGAGSSGGVSMLTGGEAFHRAYGMATPGLAPRAGSSRPPGTAPAMSAAGWAGSPAGNGVAGSRASVGGGINNLQEKVAAVFRKYDVHGRNFIAHEDMLQALGELGLMTGVSFEQLNELLDMSPAGHAGGKTYSLQQFMDFNERLTSHQAVQAREIRIKAISRMPGVPEGAESNEAIQRVYNNYCKFAAGQGRLMYDEADPKMNSTQFLKLCQDLSLMQPAGPLSVTLVDLVFTKCKPNNSRRFSYPHFLKALAAVSEEAGTNVFDTIARVGASLRLRPTFVPAQLPPPSREQQRPWRASTAASATAPFASDLFSGNDPWATEEDAQEEEDGAEARVPTLPPLQPHSNRSTSDGVSAQQPPPALLLQQAGPHDQAQPHRGSSGSGNGLVGWSGAPATRRPQSGRPPLPPGSLASTWPPPVPAASEFLQQPDTTYAGEPLLPTWLAELASRLQAVEASLSGMQQQQQRPGDPERIAAAAMGAATGTAGATVAAEMLTSPDQQQDQRDQQDGAELQPETMTGAGYTPPEINAFSGAPGSELSSGKGTGAAAAVGPIAGSSMDSVLARLDALERSREALELQDRDLQERLRQTEMELEALRHAAAAAATASGGLAAESVVTAVPGRDGADSTFADARGSTSGVPASDGPAWPAANTAAAAAAADAGTAEDTLESAEGVTATPIGVSGAGAQPQDDGAATGGGGGSAAPAGNAVAAEASSDSANSASTAVPAAVAEAGGLTGGETLPAEAAGLEEESTSRSQPDPQVNEFVAPAGAIADNAASVAGDDVGAMRAELESLKETVSALQASVMGISAGGELPPSAPEGAPGSMGPAGGGAGTDFSAAPESDPTQGGGGGSALEAETMVRAAKTDVNAFEPPETSTATATGPPDWAAVAAKVKALEETVAGISKQVPPLPTMLQQNQGAAGAAATEDLPSQLRHLQEQQKLLQQQLEQQQQRPAAAGDVAVAVTVGALKAEKPSGAGTSHHPPVAPSRSASPHQPPSPSPRTSTSHHQHDKQAAELVALAAKVAALGLALEEVQKHNKEKDATEQAAHAPDKAASHPSSPSPSSQQQAQHKQDLQQEVQQQLQAGITPELQQLKLEVQHLKEQQQQAQQQALKQEAKLGELAAASITAEAMSKGKPAAAGAAKAEVDGASAGVEAPEAARNREAIAAMAAKVAVLEDQVKDQQQKAQQQVETLAALAAAGAADKAKGAAATDSEGSAAAPAVQPAAVDALAASVAALQDKLKQQEQEHQQQAAKVAALEAMGAAGSGAAAAAALDGSKAGAPPAGSDVVAGGATSFETQQAKVAALEEAVAAISRQVPPAGTEQADLAGGTIPDKLQQLAQELKQLKEQQQQHQEQQQKQGEQLALAAAGGASGIVASAADKDHLPETGTAAAGVAGVADEAGAAAEQQQQQQPQVDPAAATVVAALEAKLAELHDTVAGIARQVPPLRVSRPDAATAADTSSKPATPTADTATGETPEEGSLPGTAKASEPAAASTAQHGTAAKGSDAAACSQVPGEEEPIVDLPTRISRLEERLQLLPPATMAAVAPAAAAAAAAEEAAAEHKATQGKAGAADAVVAAEDTAHEQQLRDLAAAVDTLRGELQAVKDDHTKLAAGQAQAEERERERAAGAAALAAARGVAAGVAASQALDAGKAASEDGKKDAASAAEANDSGEGPAAAGSVSTDGAPDALDGTEAPQAANAAVAGALQQQLDELKASVAALQGDMAALQAAAPSKPEASPEDTAASVAAAGLEVEEGTSAAVAAAAAGEAGLTPETNAAFSTEVNAWVPPGKEEEIPVPEAAEIAALKAALEALSKTVEGISCQVPPLPEGEQPPKGQDIPSRLQQLEEEERRKSGGGAALLAGAAGVGAGGLLARNGADGREGRDGRDGAAGASGPPAAAVGASAQDTGAAPGRADDVAAGKNNAAESLPTSLVGAVFVRPESLEALQRMVDEQGTRLAAAEEAARATQADVAAQKEQLGALQKATESLEAGMAEAKAAATAAQAVASEAATAAAAADQIAKAAQAAQAAQAETLNALVAAKEATAAEVAAAQAAAAAAEAAAAQATLAEVPVGTGATADGTETDPPASTPPSLEDMAGRLQAMEDKLRGQEEALQALQALRDEVERVRDQQQQQTEAATAAGVAAVGVGAGEDGAVGGKAGEAAAGEGAEGEAPLTLEELKKRMDTHAEETAALTRTLQDSVDGLVADLQDAAKDVGIMATQLKALKGAVKELMAAQPQQQPSPQQEAQGAERKGEQQNEQAALGDGGYVTQPQMKDAVQKVQSRLDLNQMAIIKMARQIDIVQNAVRQLAEDANEPPVIRVFTAPTTPHARGADGDDGLDPADFPVAAYSDGGSEYDGAAGMGEDGGGSRLSSSPGRSPGHDSASASYPPWSTPASPERPHDGATGQLGRPSEGGGRRWTEEQTHSNSAREAQEAVVRESANGRAAEIQATS